jgi:hypothetical protein
MESRKKVIATMTNLSYETKRYEKRAKLTSFRNYWRNSKKPIHYFAKVVLWINAQVYRHKKKAKNRKTEARLGTSSAAILTNDESRIELIPVESNASWLFEPNWC